MNATAERLGMETWLHAYRISKREIVDGDREFARWLDEEYVPVAGGWMY